MVSTGRSSIYLVSDPRMTQHRPVPPPAGEVQHRQLDPPCERPERLVRIMERMCQLERSLIGLRGGKGSGSDKGSPDRGNSAAPSSLQNRGGGIVPGGSTGSHRPQVPSAPFVRYNCQPVSRETGESRRC